MNIYVKFALCKKVLPEQRHTGHTLNWHHAQLYSTQLLNDTLAWPANLCVHEKVPQGVTPGQVIYMCGCHQAEEVGDLQGMAAWISSSRKRAAVRCLRLSGKALILLQVPCLQLEHQPLWRPTSWLHCPGSTLPWLPEQVKPPSACARRHSWEVAEFNLGSLPAPPLSSLWKNCQIAAQLSNKCFCRGAFHRFHSFLCHAGTPLHTT